MTDEQQAAFLKVCRRFLRDSIDVQLRAKPLGVDVPDAWRDDLANNMAPGMLEAYHVVVTDNLVCRDCGMPIEPDEGVCGCDIDEDADA